ncbi:MAG TPA: SDR family NAD(P)-dependent oxidoreductase, partial [Myxococcota bacterium]|nr:SDR family NAD(P)-dependent oxidoreductase [Myxococcota bacterium]
LVVWPCDVRDDAAVAELATAAGPVDVLVNNAGYAVFGSQAEADLGAIRELFETNVLGVARVTQALLPSLRARRGAVVNISSVAGRVVFPESGFYAASKHAVEAMSEALFEENCTFGLRVVVIEPGHFATGFQARAAAMSKPRSPDSPYAHLHALWDQRRGEALAVPQDPELVVDAILAGLASDEPYVYVEAGEDAPVLLRQRESLGHLGWMRAMRERYS